MKRHQIIQKLLSSALAVSCLWSCDDDETKSPVPLAPPSISIESIRGTTGSDQQGCHTNACCFAHEDDPAAAIGIQIGPLSPSGAIENWALQPRYSCNGAAQCGPVLLTVTDATTDMVIFSATFGSSFLTVPVSQILSASDAAAPTIGLELTFKVSLQDDYGGQHGTPFQVTVDAGGQAGKADITDEWSVMLAANCESDGAAGDATTSDAAPADASPRDGGIPDTGAFDATDDASAADTGLTDSNTPNDASEAVDSSDATADANDTGASDAPIDG